MVRPALRPVVERVPHDLASSLQSTHGVGVGDVPVHRRPEVSDEARAIGAIAFARQAEVFLPAEAGPLDQREARGLLAHELTHVVQQRTLGLLPPDGSDEAERLEQEAQDAERFHRGDTGAPSPRPSSAATATLIHPPRVSTEVDAYADQVADELVARGIATRGATDRSCSGRRRRSSTPRCRRR